MPQHKVYGYFHYLPTYYLLHVHFVHVDKASKDAREQISIEVAINNLEINAQYYQKCTLNYSVGEKHALCQALMDAKILAPYIQPVKQDLSTLAAEFKPSEAPAKNEDSLELDESNWT